MLSPRYLPALYRLSAGAILSLPCALSFLAATLGVTFLGVLTALCTIGAWLWLAREAGDLALRERRLTDREIGNRDRLRFHRHRVGVLEKSADEAARTQARLKSILARVRHIGEERDRGRTVLGDTLFDQLLADLNPSATPRRTAGLKIVGRP